MRFDDRKDLINLARTLKGLAKDDVLRTRRSDRAEKVIAACALAWAMGELIGELEREMPGAAELTTRYTRGSFDGGQQAGLWGLDDGEAVQLLGSIAQA